MRTVDEHVTALLQLVRALPPETVDLADAVGRALADDVVAAVSLPSFDNSAMDGYAVRAAEIATVPVTLAVAADVPAAPGTPPVLAPGTVARIMTGAPMPSGADAVVPVEWTDAGTDRVRIERSPQLDANVRHAGEDVNVGERVLRAGDEVTPARVALIAALGLSQVPVRRRPRIGIVATGSELVPAGQPLPHGGIYDSNAPLLAALVRRDGGEPVVRGPLVDDPEEGARLLADVADDVDLLVTSGGISAGAYEVVKDVLIPTGTVEFVKVAIQPGMPQGGGTFRGTPVVTTPGNPVSAFVSYELFVRPVLRTLAGHTDVVRAPRRGVLAEAVEQRPGRQQYRRGRWASDGTVSLRGGTGSHLLNALAQSDALVVIPAGDGTLPAGSPVDVLTVD
ncbi:MAG TPA: gephyrin-like molybdotransferase Glp [Mycobacteriales bacterium]|nr:gephyrin-like molybdotransferase Glp [Mycobacteriales bacterium]